MPFRSDPKKAAITVNRERTSFDRASKASHCSTDGCASLRQTKCTTKTGIAKNPKTRNLDFMTTTLEIGHRGAITLPKKMREKFHLCDRSLISLEETAEGILIRPAVAFPIEMYSEERLKEFDAENNGAIVKFFGKSQRGNQG